MNRSAFYKALRRKGSGVFGTSLSQKQVDGINALLDECSKQNASLDETAYILATAYGESSGKMYAVRENMNYTSAGRIQKVFSSSRRQGVSAHNLTRNPRKLANTVYGGDWGARNLGNTQPNDGWDFRGGLTGQITGRRNFDIWSSRLKVNFIGNPSLIDNAGPEICAKALVSPMLEGWATGHALADFRTETGLDYVRARKVWNGTFEAAKYAGFAEAFEAALKEANWTKSEIKRPWWHRWFKR